MIGEKKHIIFISNFLGNGGAARVIAVLANELIKKGYEVTVFSFESKGYKYTLNHQVNQIEVNISSKNNFVKKIKKLIKMRQVIRQNKGSTVIAFEYFINMQAVLACMGLNVKLIVSERNDPAQQDKRFLIKHFRNILYRLADIIVCQTEYAKAYFPEDIQKKSVIIANPIKDHLPEAFQGQRKKRIVSFGRLEKQKNYPLLIKAFKAFHKENPDYSLEIYGNGKERDHLLNLIHELKLDEFAKIYPACLDIHEKVIDASMFVLPSDYEGLSNSMIEAMAIGLPTICTDCAGGGARMIIQHRENGLLIPTNDISRLTEAMTLIAHDKGVADHLSLNGIKIKEKLKSQKIISNWECLL